MTTFSVELHMQNGTVYSATVSSTGAHHQHAMELGVRICETAPNVFAIRMNAARGFYLNKIIIRTPTYASIVPRVNHAIEYGDGGYAVHVGNGAEYFPPRSIKTVRFVLVPTWKRLLTAITLGAYQPWRAIFAIRPKVAQHRQLALPKSLSTLKGKYDAIGERILTALRTGVPDPAVGLHNQCGMWMPMGEMDKGAVGGAGIEFFPGWELSPLYRLLSHDLTMERMAISHVDATGEPIHARRQEYFTSRGWNVSTQLAEYCVPLTMTSGDDRRVPRDQNNGTCAYRLKLVPSSDPDEFYSRQHYLPYDDEHLVRGTRHAKACAFLYGDPVAKLDLAMIAADANIGMHVFDHDQLIFGNEVKRYPDHGGCDRYGRGFAHSHSAIQCAGDLGHQWAKDADLELCGELMRVQRTETASYQHCLPPPNQPQGWAPDPYFMPPPFVSIPGDLPVIHTLEAAYLTTNVSLAGYTRSAENAGRFLSKTMPYQWIAAVPTAQPQTGEVESFSCWPMWGALGATNQAWIDTMTRMVPPGAGAVCGPNVSAALLAAGNHEASAKASEAAERAGR